MKTVVSPCSSIATSLIKGNIVQYHHWREGNLPPNSKCVSCKKTCWSSECLAGMRCEWCGVTAHATCYKSLPVECKFGSLREIMLPPSCLTIPRMDVPMETIMGINRKPSQSRTVSEEWSSSGDSKTEDEEKERRSPREKDSRDKDKDTDYEVVRVFDGNASMKKRLYRTITVPRNAPAHLLLNDPHNYYVTEICESGERELEENVPIRSQLKTPDGKRPSVFLRYREKNPDRGYIRVYPGALRVSTTYKNIPVTRDTTSEELISLALRKFGMDDAQPENFSVMEVLLDKGSHMIPEGVHPLMVFVNVKSGGCQGLDLITSFRKLLNPHQVFNLDNGGPLPGLYVFRNVPNYKILVCGGDGSVGWVLSCLDNVGQDAVCQSPPMAIVPLGTGNDLARVLRWGPGYTGGEDPLNVLRDVIDAEEIKLDRWTVIFHPNEKEQDETKVAIANDTNSANTNEDPTKIFVMNNYFGIGIDAELCLDFHNAREEKPDKFNSRLHNKSVYLKMGLKRMVNRKSCKDLHRHVKVEVDGKLIDLPPVEGIVILNILSWGSGANPWGPDREDTFNKPTHYDGMLEIVGVTGVVHMGQIQSGLRTGVRIAQGGHTKASPV
nr:hypothetical protein BaRGS_020669 [Batillaria attramentaria]